jgi:hypothetical protein
MTKGIKIIKASGEEQIFNENKLRDSLKRSGASENTINMVVGHVRKELKEGMTTQQIYKHAFALIKKDKPVAIRYSLRQAVMALGPTGFPFERFLGEILKTQGFKVKTGIVLYGFCVSHEVDVLASRDDKHIFVEAKFHNRLGVKTDLKVALYVKARHDDLRKVHKLKEGANTPIIHEGWLVTNTKLTSKARQYGRCSGLKVIGWNYPKEGNLQDMVLRSGVHPISILTTLSQKRKKILFDMGVVLCKDLKKHKDLLKQLGINDKGIADVMDEVSLLCGGGLQAQMK